MTYEDLPNADYIPTRFNQTIFLTEDDVDDVVFSLKFEIAKCANIDNVNKFINNVNQTGMFFLSKNERVRQPIGLFVSSYYSSFNNFIKHKEELKHISNHASSAGFKAHDAKNLYMNIVLKSGDIDNKTKKKIDLFVNSHPMFMKTFSRRIQTNKMNYSLDKDYSDFGRDGSLSNRSPLRFSNDTIVFRMFRSTLNVNTILSTIEFCKLLYYFCKNEIYVDDLLEDHNVEEMFNNYVKSKSVFLNDYLQSNKIECKKETDYFTNDGNLNNGYSNCSDVTLATNIVCEDVENDSWKFFNGNDINDSNINHSIAVVRDSDRIVGYVTNNDTLDRNSFRIGQSALYYSTDNNSVISHLNNDNVTSCILDNHTNELNNIIDELIEQNTELG